MAIAFRACSLLVVMVAGSFLATNSTFADEKKTEKPADKQTGAKKVEKTIEQIKVEWSKELSGADLIGFYTTDGKDSKQKPDRYRHCAIQPSSSPARRRSESTIIILVDKQ